MRRAVAIGRPLDRTTKQLGTLSTRPVRPGIMIKFLANLFRGVSYIVGVSAPPPGENERPFVFMWLGIIVFGAAVSALLLYLILRMHVS
jgi:hypothetical protein